MSLNYYSNIFKKLLLRNIVIRSSNKVYKTGKLKNFDIKQFYIKLYLENNKNNIKLIELPYPFIVTQSPDNTTTLNYHVSSFCGNETDVFFKVNLLNSTDMSRFYDNLIEISVVD